MRAKAAQPIMKAATHKPMPGHFKSRIAGTGPTTACARSRSRSARTARNCHKPESSGALSAADCGSPRLPGGLLAPGPWDQLAARVGLLRGADEQHLKNGLGFHGCVQTT
jgi:hypothetical protein